MKSKTLTVFRFFQINGRQDGSSRGWGSTVPLLQVNVAAEYESIYSDPLSWNNSHRREPFALHAITVLCLCIMPRVIHVIIIIYSGTSE